ncbi:MAG TPA: complex I NDUFA9 subunit family protein [Steroidobacteraceae bacterium]|nr:complex I NDUFA9 subunit family protein [Steroidobacteraceae bacterium]
MDVKFTGPRLRICVLGGTGFVGTELVTQLADAGHWLRVPTRSLNHGAHLTVLPTVELISANIHDARVLGELLAGMDVAINLVGVLNERSGARFRDVHVELVTKLIAEARRAHVPRLLHMSSLGADAERAPSRYLRSKGQAEAQVAAAGSFLEYTIFRPSVIFGPRDSLTNRFAGLLRLSRGVLPLARPRTRFAPVYVNDVARAFVRSLREPSTMGRTYELCGPDVLTLGQIVRATAAAARLRCVIMPLPDILARLQGVLLGWLPGAPFSLDNFRSLTLDSVCRENGCAALHIEPQHMAAVLPTYLGDLAPEARLDRFRETVEH